MLKHDRHCTYPPPNKRFELTAEFNHPRTATEPVMVQLGVAGASFSVLLICSAQVGLLQPNGISS